MRYGIMGGTFDPIHLGHLIISEYIRVELGLDKIIFIPNGRPPHKKVSTSDEDRYLMTKMAIEDNEFFEISDIEIKGEVHSYTIDTIKELKKMDSNVEYFFIIGSDSAKNFHKWKDYREIFEYCKIVCYQRKGFNLDDLSLENELSSKIIFIDSMLLDISSTEIRRRVKEKKSIKYLVTDIVEKFIYQKKLYQEEGEMIEKILKQLKDTLKTSRYEHSLRVADRASELAHKHGEDSERAYLAGLLHDIGKVRDEDVLLKISTDFDIILEEKIKSDTVNFHCILGEIIAKKVYDIQDKDILNSIRYHTTGREDMSPLEKIVYLADYTEYGRNFEKVEEARRLADENLDKAMIFALENTIIHIIESKQILHLDTVKARNFLLNEKFGGE
ncbi:MAG: nicotinate-nucleotide adenylyltransferase [Andreesenia angusta]|nr:nicotinate-nucleotide adenylyltransferase [Andreesenia angusta]